MSGIVDIWNKFAFLQQFSASGFGENAQQQFLAMVFEILPPFIAGFIISQGSKWSSDLAQGRVQLFLSAPISWTGLILRRYAVTIIGSESIILSSLGAVFIGAKSQGAEIAPSALLRVFVMTTLFAAAFTSLNALVVAILHGKNATTFILSLIHI